MRAALRLPAATVVEPPSELGTISEERVVSRVCRFFEEKVHPADWDRVQENYPVPGSFLVQRAAPLPVSE
jgi:hypothetical protein